MATFSSLSALTSSPKLRTWVRVVGEFMAGQTITNLVASLTGFFLVRWLTKQALAEYNFAFTVQTLIVALTDAGFMSALVGLVGERVNEPETVGKYIAAVSWFRSRIFIYTSLASLVLIPFLLRNQPWPLLDKASIVASVIFTSYVRGWSVYFPALVMQRKLNVVYRPQLGINVGRLGLSTLLHLTSLLNGHISIWLNALGGAIYSYITKVEALKLVVMPKVSDPETRAEVLKYVYPLTFNVVYNSFQGQVSQFLITYFGNTDGMADAAALSRLGFAFSILTTVSWFVLEPYCARIPKAQLKKKYPLVILLAAIPVAALVAVGYLGTDLLVLMLGAKYANLRPEIPLAMLGMGMGCLAGTLWTLSMARRWMFWWYTALNISVALITQVICIPLLDVSTIHGIVLLGFYMAVTGLTTNILVTLYCLYFLPESADGGAAPPGAGITAGT